MTDTSTLAPANINDIEDVPSADLRIKDPRTGALMGITIQLAGPEHPSRKSLAMANQRRVRAYLSKHGKVPIDSPEEAELSATVLLVTATLGWSAPAGSGMPEFSQAAAQALYTDPKRQWLRRQVAAALDDAELFIGGSASG